MDVVQDTTHRYRPIAREGIPYREAALRIFYGRYLCNVLELWELANFIGGFPFYVRAP